MVPTGAINPLTVDDEGGLTMLQQTGEFLVFDDPKTYLVRPMLATSWKTTDNGTTWVFTIRPDVKFSDGTPMTVDDVVYSFQQQCDRRTRRMLSRYSPGC